MLVGLPWTSDNQDAEPNYTKTQGTNAPDACVLGKTEKRYAYALVGNRQGRIDEGQQLWRAEPLEFSLESELEHCGIKSLDFPAVVKHTKDVVSVDK
ncbi:hypothetical protein N7508_007283 [Penicillium antarcticum]|uniref:uncharacterized protein n=1 Tax=Penicillium antarcticum TaxID=416450 RepID=UPI0023A657E7|nr:uncharacterized protein N7508_007283 [Penicillium antarcticum]KAJ5302420.1 hypothetical protein N7508_007283 [Penicillium antarcticum]